MLFIVVKCVTEDMPKRFEQYLLSDLTYGKFIMTFELGKKKDNPHIHILLETDRTKKQFRNVVVNKFPELIGAKRLTSKPMDEDLISSLGYVLKEELGILYNSLAHEDTLEQARKHNREKYPKNKEKNGAYSNRIVENYQPLTPQGCSESVELTAIWVHIQDYLVEHLSDYMTGRLYEDWIKNLFYRIYFKHYKNMEDRKRVASQFMPKLPSEHSAYAFPYNN